MTIIRLVVLTVFAAAVSLGSVNAQSNPARRGTPRGNKPHKQLKHEPIIKAPEFSKGNGAAVKGYGTIADDRAELSNSGKDKPAKAPKKAEKKAAGKGKSSGKN